VDRGIELAEKHRFAAPLGRWREARDEMRGEIELRGVDHKRGIFVRSFDSEDVDAALLLLPMVNFVPYDDAKMVRTTAVIRSELTRDGLLTRYQNEDGLKGSEGAFLACTFWLVVCLVRQGRKREARAAFERATRCANDMGLFAEQYAARGRQMLGNFPQGLTHLAHISAALALMATAPQSTYRHAGATAGRAHPRAGPNAIGPAGLR
jgi:GH15 family glucan-1,4-alpha-glucosidase